jgi:uncharacterized protein (TIGR02646 family)
MIRITKPDPPAILTTKGASATLADCALYDSSLPHRTGETAFKFQSTLYAARAVKDALLGAQNDKCAFCESWFTHTGYGDVEHFRPKGGTKQKDADELVQPGYYWLAYEWSNLFASCQLCNQQFKKNRFPLKIAKHRARSHRDPIDKEKPLLIDPARLDPTAHIGFREEFAYSIADGKEGVATIDTMGLNRDALAEARRERLEDFRVWMRTRTIFRSLVESNTAPPEVIAELQRMDAAYPSKVSDTAEYTAMIRCEAGSVSVP